MSTYTERVPRWSLRTAATIVAVSQFLAPLGAIAQVPSASSVIQSSASASYVDYDGETRTATSNVVQTTVQQVGAFTISAGGTKSAASGAPVALMHTITNAGNGTDTFTIEVQDQQLSGNQFASIDVFADADANGLADNNTSLLSGGAVTNAALGASNSITIAAGERYTYVVVYTLPTTAGANWTNTASVKVTPGNASLGYSPADRTEVDTIHRTDASAFSAALTHSAPLVAAVGGGAWGATPNSGEAGVGTVYTFTYTNNGSSTGQIYLRDALPVGLDYVPGSAVWSSNPGVALAENGAFGGSSPTSLIAYRVTGQVVEALIKDVPAGHSGTLSFRVQVNAAAPIGALTSQAKFSLESCVAADLTAASDGTGCGTAGTNDISATFTVLPRRGLQFGPVLDSTAGTAVAADTVTQTGVVAGGSVRFTIPVSNTGTAPDTYKLSLDKASMTFPVGTLFTWFNADGFTPLQNTVGGSDVDTGAVPAGTTVNVVLQATVPASTPVASNANLTVKALANSFVDAARLDAVNLTVTNVIAGLVDLTSSAAGSASDIGPGAVLNAVSQSLSVSAGSAGYNSSEALNTAAGSAAYDLYVNNHDSINLVFSLDSSLTTTFPGNLPAGWTVKYHLFNTNVATTVAGAAVSTVAVPAGGQTRVLAVVTPLSTSSDVSALDVYFRARSTTASSLGSIINDHVRTQITVTAPATRGFILSPAGSQRQIAPASVVDFPHTLLNNGSQSCGAVGGLTVTTSMQPVASGADDWQVVLYQDNGSTPGQIDSSDTLLTSGTLSALPAGTAVPLIVRVYSPGSSVVGGASVNVTLTITDQDTAPNCGVQSLTNVVSVNVGQLEVSKVQLHDASCNTATEPTEASMLSAAPGQCIVYRSTVRNNGTAPVTNVSLNDVVPHYTTYATGNQPTTQCEAAGLQTTGGAALVPTLTTTARTLSCGSAANVLIPGGTITLRYRVTVNTH